MYKIAKNYGRMYIRLPRNMLGLDEDEVLLIIILFILIVVLVFVYRIEISLKNIKNKLMGENI